MRESKIQRDIRLHLGSKPDLVVWRNNVGAWQDDHGNWIEYGVGGPGASDLLCMLSINVWTDEPLTLARWFCLEVKSPGGRTKKDRAESQRLFRDLVNKRGGYAADVRSVEEAEFHYQRARQGLSA